MIGIDVSSHNGAIVWEKVKAAGCNFAMIRAGYGKAYDPYFTRNATQCSLNHIPFGVYWFSYALNAADAKEEALLCISLLHRFEIEMPVCFDFEYDSINNMKKNNVKATKSLVTEIAECFLTNVESANYFAMNYTNLDFYRNYYTDAFNRRFGIWFAGVKDVTKPAVKAYIYQYADPASYDGISGVVDIDYTDIDFPKYLRDHGCNNLTLDDDAKALLWAQNSGIIRDSAQDPVSWKALAGALYRLDQRINGGK